MSLEFQRINSFLEQHHVMSLATTDFVELSVCSLFYSYSKEKNSFVVASDRSTTHIQHILQNSNISGNILLETKTVGKVQGVQFQGKMKLLKDSELKALYFKTFPYALTMLPTLWQIEVKYFKMTDNRLGFGKKIELYTSSMLVKNDKSGD
ncbi:MAG: hypothetical protein U9P38_00020 [Campylobacterota bacterium]|nr:hypothetical protein [Campylobacterota bacterium]